MSGWNVPGKHLIAKVQTLFEDFLTDTWNESRSKVGIVCGGPQHDWYVRRFQKKGKAVPFSFGAFAREKTKTHGWIQVDRLGDIEKLVFYTVHPSELAYHFPKIKTDVR